jgi:glutaredoxin 3
MSVKVYTTPSCPYCGMAKKYLEAKNVRYEEVDVSKDRNAAFEMVRKSGQRGVPVIDFEGSVIVGFDKDRIDSLL